MRTKTKKQRIKEIREQIHQLGRIYEDGFMSPKIAPTLKLLFKKIEDIKNEPTN